MKVWDKGKRNVILDQAGLPDRSSLSKNSVFSIETEARKGSNEMYDWLKLDHRYNTKRELEMSDMLCLSAEEWIQKLREIGMWKYTGHLRYTYMKGFIRRTFQQYFVN